VMVPILCMEMFLGVSVLTSLKGISWGRAARTRVRSTSNGVWVLANGLSRLIALYYTHEAVLLQQCIRNFR